MFIIKIHCQRPKMKPNGRTGFQVLPFHADSIFAISNLKLSKDICTPTVCQSPSLHHNPPQQLSSNSQRHWRNAFPPVFVLGQLSVQFPEGSPVVRVPKSWRGVSVVFPVGSTKIKKLEVHNKIIAWHMYKNHKNHPDKS